MFNRPQMIDEINLRIEELKKRIVYNKEHSTEHITRIIKRKQTLAELLTILNNVENGCPLSEIVLPTVKSHTIGLHFYNSVNNPKSYNYKPKPDVKYYHQTIEHFINNSGQPCARLSIYGPYKQHYELNGEKLLSHRPLYHQSIIVLADYIPRVYSFPIVKNY